MGLAVPRTAITAVLMLAAALLIATPGSRAALPAAPGQTRTTVLENDRVRARVNDYPPGSQGPEHEHLVPRVVVVLQGGTLEIRAAGGEAKTLQLSPGQVVWRPAEKHAIANPGATAVRVVEVDIKDCR